MSTPAGEGSVGPDDERGSHEDEHAEHRVEHHHVELHHVDEQIEAYVEETAADVRVEAQLLERAIGGWRGLIDSGLPTVVFVIAYAIDQQRLMPAVVAAVVAGVAVALWRVIRREPVQHVLSGFVGVAIAAFFSWRTGKAEDFFLPGLLTNLAYGSAFLLSILVCWPLLGVAMGFLTGERTAWRREPELRRLYAAASWIWVGVFLGRLVVQAPFYFAGAVGVLGVLKIVMGWPLFLAGAYLTYRMLAPVMEERRKQAATRTEHQADETTD